MSLAHAFYEYFDNFRVALSFALLLAFLFPATQTPGVFVGSGSIFAEYSLLKPDIVSALLPLALILLFLFFYSIFVTLMVFAVKRDVAGIKAKYHLQEKIQKYAVKLFAAYAVFSLASIALYSILTAFVPVSILVLLLGIASLPLFFLPQAVVVEDLTVMNGIKASIAFIGKCPKAFLSAFILGSILVLAVPAIEYAIDSYFALMGSFISLILMTVFVIPFLETYKTELYMQKFDLLKFTRGIKQSTKPVQETIRIKDIS